MSSFFSEIKTYFHKFRTLVFVLFLFFMTATFSFFATSNPIESSAVSTAGFKPGNIISDAVMANYNSMTVAEIQAFLTKKNPCNNRDYNAYVRQTNQYPSVQWHWAGTPSDGHFVCISEERFGDGTVIGEGQTAAEIIYSAAQANKINPQVLLVLIEKEQSLISDPIPHSGQYRAATGYGCPDTAACDSKYYGFKNQVYRAAELFRYTLDHGYYAYPEKTHGVYVAYNPSSSCGRSEVYIENRATAALYRYTPYQPNSAALNAGFGMGDSCSAYGNRNFYLYFTQWFGSTQASVEGEQIIIPDGEYSLTSGVTGEYNLGVSGSNAQLTQANFDNHAQRWRFKRDTSTGYYTISNVYSGRTLMASSTEISSGANAQVSYASGCASQWKPYRASDNYLVFESACSNGMVLNVENSTNAHESNVNIDIYNKTISQKWTLHVGPVMPDGYYSIMTSVMNDKVADIAGGAKANGTNIQLYGNNKTMAQKWLITYEASTDSYLITNTVANKNLEVRGGNMSNGANVQIYSPNSGCAQRWKILETLPDQYSLFSACSIGKALDLSNAQTSNGTNIQLWSYDPNTSAQRWKLIAAPVLSDGTYTIRSAVTDDEIKTVDLSNAGTLNETNIQLWSYDSNTVAQKWDITFDSDTNYYSISNPKSGKSPDIFAASISNGSNIHLYANHNGCTQKWRIIESAEGRYSIFSGCDNSYALDVSNSLKTNGTNIQLWSYDPNVLAQKWSFIRREE